MRNSVHNYINTKIIVSWVYMTITSMRIVEDSWILNSILSYLFNKFGFPFFQHLELVEGVGEIEVGEVKEGIIRLTIKGL